MTNSGEKNEKASQKLLFIKIGSLQSRSLADRGLEFVNVLDARIVELQRENVVLKSKLRKKYEEYILNLVSLN